MNSSNVRPNPSHNRVVAGNRGKGKRRASIRVEDGEQPRDIGGGIFQKGRDFPEVSGGSDGKNMAEEIGLVTALADKSKGAVKSLGDFGGYPADGPVVKGLRL